MNIREQEYLTRFDSVLSEIWNYTPDTTRKAQLDNETIIKIRKDCMEMSYYKYGPVRENYVLNDYMHPIEDLCNRVDKYEKCHNIEYMLDTMNYTMLAYWRHMSRIGADSVNVSDDEMSSMIKMMSTIFNSSNTINVPISIIVHEYNDTKDILCLLKIAALAMWETKYPHYADAFYKGTDNETLKPDGFCINEIRNFDK